MRGKWITLNIYLIFNTFNTDSINEPVPSPTRFANNMKDAVILDPNEDDMPPLTIPDFFLENMKLSENRKALGEK